MYAYIAGFGFIVYNPFAERSFATIKKIFIDITEEEIGINRVTFRGEGERKFNPSPSPKHPNITFFIDCNIVAKVR